MYFRLLVIATLLLLISSESISQNTDNLIIEGIIEEIAESNNEELDYTQLLEDLYSYSQNPLNLNIANRDDLEKFQFLTDFHIEDILEYQRNEGEMLSIYELQYLNSFSYKDIKRILPFVVINPIPKKSYPNLKYVLKYGQNSLFLRTKFLVQEQIGYTNEPTENKQYQGNKYKFYTRYQFNYKQKIKFGFVAEKDPGEAFFKESQKAGFDHYSAHLQISDFSIFKTITLGDYQARFGQGLIAWAGLSLNKSSFVMSVKKKYDGLRKYSATNENQFMRGIGATVSIKKIDLTSFVSYKAIDGNIEMHDSLSTEDYEFTSFQRTGLHRNTDELTDKHTVNEFIYGGNIKLNMSNLKIGGSYINYYYEQSMNKPEKLYNQYDFSGNHGFNASIDYQFSYKNIYLFGEEAISHTGGHALLNSAMFKPAHQISLIVLQRFYSKNYLAPYASGFANQSKTSNEKGIYLGVEIHPIRKLKVSSFFDIYSYPWLKYRTYSPSNGTDFLTQIDYVISPTLDLSFKYKQRSNYQNSSFDLAGVSPLVPIIKKQFRFTVNYNLSDNLNLKNRVEFSNYHKSEFDKKTGFMIYQDINYKIEKIPIKLNFRIAFFDTEYDSRIYAYENDILYGFSIPAYSGQGIRTYLNLRYTLIKNFIDIWIRYSNTTYHDQDEIGSNYDIIYGRNKSEVKFQLRLKF